MREPSLTTRPPSRLGSTRTSIATWLPTARRNCSLERLVLRLVSGCAAVTSAVTSPRRSASLARYASIIAGTAKSRRLRATTARKSRVSCDSPALLGERRDRLALLGARQHRAADEAQQIGARRAASRAARADRRRPRRAPALVGQLEQRRRITFGQAGNACRFGSQWRRSSICAPGARVAALQGLVRFRQRRPRGPPRPREIRAVPTMSRARRNRARLAGIQWLTCFA